MTKNRKSQGQKPKGNKKISTFVVLIILISFLSACGFHLRGSAKLPPQLSELWVSGENAYGPLALSLKQMLSHAGVNITVDARIVLYISEETQEKQRISVSKSAYVDEYRLISRVSFELRRASGITVTNTETVSAQTLYQDNASNPASKANEERQLREDLINQLALQIVRRLSATNMSSIDLSNASSDKPATPDSTTDTDTDPETNHAASTGEN